jgi:gamma-glutamyl-gamma-aminobutyraldehyde dehydrogenase
MEQAVSAAYNGIFANMGEVCSAGSRLLVERPVYNEFIERFIAEGQHAYAPGDPLDPDTNMGPLVDRESQQRVLGMIESGKKEGATLHFGGNAPEDLGEHLASGAFVNPTLFGDVSNNMSIARNEIFGPVASVIPFDGPEEAISIANDTIYGLAAGIWTRDINKAFRLVKNIEAGVVWINSYEDGDMTQPFGGYKQSGQARDKCMESVKSYMQSKSAWFRLAES